MLEFATCASPTACEFRAWLRDADPGAILPYHQGFLALDVDAAVSGCSAHARQALLGVARLARLASERGLVHLAQKRSDPGPFTYFAVKRRRVTDSATPVFAGRGKSPPAADSE